LSLNHAILGFLKDKPLTGYELKSVFDLTVRHFWPADQSRIYRTLSSLTDEGWTEVEVVEQDTRPDRKVYHITDAGRAELHRWLTTPLPEKGAHHAELVQMFFAGQLDDTDILTMLRRMAKMAETEAKILSNHPALSGDCCDEEMPRDLFFKMLTLHYGIYISNANATWLNDIITRIERGEHEKRGK
jgi:PadR family transcriptional regulator AphA